MGPGILPVSIGMLQTVEPLFADTRRAERSRISLIAATVRHLLVQMGEFPVMGMESLRVIRHPVQREDIDPAALFLLLEQPGIQVQNPRPAKVPDPCEGNQAAGMRSRTDTLQSFRPENPAEPVILGTGDEDIDVIVSQIGVCKGNNY